jgi:hypothetical protein
MVKFDSPVLLIWFNRPDLSLQIIERLREVKPERIYVAVDGARPDKKEEEQLCIETRKVVSQIDGPCEVKTLFQERNLGCKKGVITAINWFFENVEMGIILEDDCLPEPSFFPYCRELLERYATNKKIMMISGDRFAPEKSEESYYFSHSFHIWGWATWRRVWELYDPQIKSWGDDKNKDWLKIFLNCNIARIRYWSKAFDNAYQNKIDTWDIQWVYCCMINQGLSIHPCVNLIRNIGFRGDATHTVLTDDSLASLSIKAMEFPLRHPETFIVDVRNDDHSYKYVFNLNNSLLKRLIKRINFHLFKK